MKKISSVILLFIFFISGLKAEIVSKIEINGNQRISNETIKIYGKINVGKEISENEKVNTYLKGKKIKKIIFVKNKIINIVF